MTGIAQGFVPIAGRPAAPPRVGLLTSAPDVTGDLPEKWVNGIAWNPEACLPESNNLWWACPVGEGADPTGERTIDTNPTDLQYRPYLAWVGETCSTLGAAAADLEGRALRKFLASESRILEAELWQGTAAQAAGFPNAYLTDGSSDDYLGSHGLVYALAALQEYLADSINERGMIHASVRTASLWYAAGAIRREANLLLDPFDNIIVAGQGYDGSGPGGEQPPLSGDAHWAYATPIVQIARDTRIATVPTDLADSVVRDTNTVKYRVERMLAAFFDATCAHGSIEVNLCSPCCEPSGS